MGEERGKAGCHATGCVCKNSNNLTCILDLGWNNFNITRDINIFALWKEVREDILPSTNDRGETMI